MPTYSFNIQVPAHTAAEAEAKLQLLLQMGAFFSDFNVRQLAEVFVRYKLLHYAGKVLKKKTLVNTSNKS